MRRREPLDETRQRRRIIPEDELLGLETPPAPTPPTPTIPTTTPTPTPTPTPSAPTVKAFTLSVTDLPVLADKSVGDTVSLNVEGRITDITGDDYTLEIVSVREARAPRRRTRIEEETEILTTELRRPTPPPTAGTV